MTSIGEFFQLLGVGLGNMAWVSWQTGQELWHFGRCGWWWRLRGVMQRVWLGSSPLRVIAEAGQGGLVSQDDEDLTYGETLPGTAFALGKQLKLSSSDKVVELGCGRAVFAFTAALAFGCEAVGIDVVPGYIERCEQVASILGLRERTSFIHGDFRQQSIAKGSVYFVSGTCLQPQSWHQLVARLERAAPVGARAISLSKALPESRWEVLGVSKMPFTWGKATVYVQRRIGPNAG